MFYKKINVLSLIVCVIFCVKATFSSLNAEQTYATQIIMTILDESEPSIEKNEITKNGDLVKGNLGSIATDLLLALYEEQSIIIVNSSVVHYLMRYLEEVSNNPFGLIPLKTVQPDHWIKKKISNYLYILIPKNYIHALPNYKELKNLNLAMLDVEELALGIRFKKFKEMSDAEFMKSKNHLELISYPKKTIEEELELSRSIITFTSEISWISHHFIENIENMFLSKDIYSHFIHCLPRSIIIPQGHGSPYYSLEERIQELESCSSETKPIVTKLKQLQSSGKTVYRGGKIAGFNSKDFRAFIAFLAKNVSVPLFFITTCYGSEINIQAALDDVVVPFTMISGTLSSGISKSSIGTHKSWTSYNNSTREDDVKITVITPLFKNFFETLNKNLVQSDRYFLEALQHIYYFSNKEDTTYNNIPSIKRPGEPWKVLENPHVITLDQTSQQGISLDTSLLFNDNKKSSHDAENAPDYPNVIVLQTTEVPYEIILSGKHVIDMPAFISIVPGDTVHHFSKIDAATFQISAFFRAFFKIPDLRENKVFIIDELRVKNNIKNNIKSPEEIIHLKNVVIIHELEHDELIKKSVFFEYNNSEWHVTSVGEEAPLMQCLKEKPYPEKIKLLLHRLKYHESEENEPIAIIDHHETLSTKTHNTFIKIITWLYSFVE